jgi:hypothetical protein
MMMKTDAKEGEHSIAKYNTHRQSAAHTDHHFCQQDPIQMEPADRNTGSVLARRGRKRSRQRVTRVMIEGVGLGKKWKGTDVERGRRLTR